MEIFLSTFVFCSPIIAHDFGAFSDASRETLKQAIERGRGGIGLELTDAQYRKLKRDGDDRRL